MELLSVTDCASGAARDQIMSPIQFIRVSRPCVHHNTIFDAAFRLSAERKLTCCSSGREVSPCQLQGGAVESVDK